VKQTWHVFTCDEPDCGRSLRVMAQREHWTWQPQQEAMNQGWWITSKVTLCPEHEWEKTDAEAAPVDA